MSECKWCGEEGIRQFKSGEYCCSQYPQQCPSFKKKLSSAKIGKHRSDTSVQKQKNSMMNRYMKPKAIPIDDIYVLCDYGCGKLAKYRFKNGKVCCENNYRKCEGYIKNKVIVKKTGPQPEEIIEKVLCDYGCGKLAKYRFKNGKACCEKSIQNCPSKKRSTSKYTRDKLRKINKKPLEYWQDAYPLFFAIEKPILNENNEIIVRCKNDNCKKLFSPTYTQLYERIRNIEREDGGGDYFYCSDDCKYNCQVFNQKIYPKNFKIDYSREVQPDLRKLRLEIDNNRCVKCGRHISEVELHCHHVEGIRWEPLESADIDKAMTLCEPCHNEVHSKDGCTYQDMQCSK